MGKPWNKRRRTAHLNRLVSNCNSIQQRPVRCLSSYGFLSKPSPFATIYNLLPPPVLLWWLLHACHKSGNLLLICHDAYLPKRDLAFCFITIQTLLAFQQFWGIISKIRHFINVNNTFRQGLVARDYLMFTIIKRGIPLYSTITLIVCT